ncbi:zinc-ribbon domain-containing protein [Corallococcus sicarius]|uniref:Gliding motility protein n=1 Tax=Corallococcus sicarius TaxID=2316726 RepID=A0A3A8MZW7_9BACT|nr:zinc-ribbon domain-containing protein [Corallococcus sicarius]RKH37758.1 gliding motility protein [Corallococcus sicarius]
MRIVCQKCAAAYAIDDRLISAKGVRAQCPRCRHLQLVKREASAASVTATPGEGAAPPVPGPEPKSNPAAPAQPLAREPRSNPAAPAQPLAREPRSNPAAAAQPLAREPRSNPAAATAPRSAPAAAKPAEAPAARSPAKAAPASDLFGDFGSMPELGPPGSVDPFADPGPPEPRAAAPARAEPVAKPAPPKPAAPEPAADPLLDFLGPAPSSLGSDGASPPAPARPSAATASGGVSLGRMSARAPAQQAAPPAQTEAHANCRSCGKALTDAFDQALGVCDECRARNPADPRDASVVVEPQAPAPAPSGMGRAARGEGDLELPMLSNLDPSAASSGGDLDLMGGAQASGNEPRLAGATALATDSRISSVKPARTSHVTAAPVRTAHRGGSGGGVRSLAVGLLVLVLLGGGAAAGYFLVYKPRQEAALQASRSQGPAPVSPQVLEAVDGWRLQFLELSGTSAEHLAEGQQQLAKDQRVAYAEAEESFQQALILDPRSTDAIAGYVQALALGRGPGMDDHSFQEARGLIQAAESTAGMKPGLLVAHANLLLSRARQSGNLEEASRLADSARSHPEATDAQKAEAYLVLGRAKVATSRELANKDFDEARRLAPKLKRVDFYSALAHEEAGQYGLALKLLARRLELDPQDWDSLEASARIYVEVGETGRARKLYEDRAKAKGKAGDMRSTLALAVLRYQAEGNAREAVRELRALAKGVSRYGPRDASEIWVHLAAAERTAGNADNAVKAAAEALKVVPALPEAHLQWFLVALAGKDAPKAREHLKGFQGRLEDPALEGVLEGRVLLLEQNPAGAQERFLAAVKADPRRVDAQLLAGVAAATAKKREESFRLFYPVLEARIFDPLHSAPRPALTRFWLRPGDTLAGVENVVQELGGRPDDVQPLLYEGLVRFHQGDRQGAERLLRSVVETGTNNGAAQAYRALLALDAKPGQSAQALELAEKAVALERSLPVARLSLGLAQAAAGDVERAKRTVRSVLEVAPTMLSAQTKLAELEIGAQPQAAREMLEKVVGLDPSCFPAKKLLFTLDERG